MHTNINIKNSQNTFNYIIEYKNNADNILYSDTLFYINNESIFDDLSSQCDNISFWNNNAGVVKHYDHWFPVKGSPVYDFIPSQYKTSKIILYFPDYSVDTYNSGVKYALNISTFIHGHSIILASKIIDRLDALACSQVKTFMSNRYYECVEFDIIDPYDLIYSDDWRDFRVNVCGEAAVANTVNATGSVLYVTLYPVVEDETGYRKADGYDGGQNSININKSLDDFLHLHISTNIDKPILSDLSYDGPRINCKLLFNDVYKGNISDYLYETYGLDYDSYIIDYELVIGNEQDLYVVLNKESLSECIFTKDEITAHNLQNWDGYVEGINIVCSANIINNDGDSILYLLSNSIPLTQEIFKYFVGGEEFKVYTSKNSFDFDFGGGSITKPSTEVGSATKILHNINLDEIDMNIVNINAVNKIVNNVIKLSKPEDSKSGLMQPVFFRVVESSNITIHPAVTETICINLDSYKSKVTTFILQIGGVNFTEIGRTQSGVLFKLHGGKLTGVNTEGVYYVLNQDSELVTTGKYNSII